LDALYLRLQGKLQKELSDIMFETDPKEVLRDFWRLQFKLKWESDYFHPEKTQPMLDKLTWAFTKLNYESPELEAKLLEQIIEAVMVSILRQGKESQVALKDFILKKYKL